MSGQTRVVPIATDVLVIGAGPGGLSTAVSVYVLDKAMQANRAHGAGPRIRDG